MAVPYVGAASGAECLSHVELHLECRNLLDKDIMSKSDPCAVMFMARRGGQMMEVGRTENVKNCLNPKFAKFFTVEYHFEEVQKVVFAVYDIDNTTPSLSDDDFLGQVECTLGELVSSSVCTRPLLLRNGYKAGNGTITIRAEEVKEGGEVAQIFFKAQKLDSKDFLGKSDPYLEIMKPGSDGSWQIAYRSEVVKNNLNPTWRPVNISLMSLCRGNYKQQIKLDIYDWDSDGTHDYIGSCATTMEDLMKAATQAISLPVINHAKQAKKKSYKNSGLLIVTSCKVIKENTFLEFVLGGMQINFTVGIDFTASNGNPLQPTSLHYINEYQPNEYMQAIRAVGQVCQDYDSDKLFPALGFGARIPPSTDVYHEFAINFNPQNPFCAGIDGVLQAYSNCIRRVQLYGPTNVAPIINHVARFAASAQQEESSKGAHAYFILLLLTDGVLSDMGETKLALVRASALPMSLIIVGVGGADFAAMNELDGDNGILRAMNGEPVKRDIVQFVPFRDFKQSNPADLARHVLAEVPKQVVEYYKMRNLKPNPKREVPVQVPANPSLQPAASSFTPGAPPSQPGAPSSQPGAPPGQPGANPQWQGAPQTPAWQGSAPNQPGMSVPQWQGSPTHQPGAQSNQYGAQPYGQGAPSTQYGGPPQGHGVPPHPSSQPQWQPVAPNQYGAPQNPSGAPSQVHGTSNQPGAPYPQAGVPYPQAGAPYPQAGAPYPQAGAPYPQAGAPYPQTGVPSPQVGAPYPQHAPYPQTGVPSPQAGAPYPQHGAPYPQTGVPSPQAGAPYPKARAPYPPGVPSPRHGTSSNPSGPPPQYPGQPGVPARW